MKTQKQKTTTDVKDLRIANLLSKLKRIRSSYAENSPARVIATVALKIDANLKRASK